MSLKGKMGKPLAEVNLLSSAEINILLKMEEVGNIQFYTW